MLYPAPRLRSRSRKASWRPPPPAWVRRDELWRHAYGSRPQLPSTPAVRRRSPRGTYPQRASTSSWNTSALAGLLLIVVLALAVFWFTGGVSSTPSAGGIPPDTTKVVGGWDVPCDRKAPARSFGAYSVIGAPTISIDFIKKVLTYYNSPASDQAPNLYYASVRCGIDPAYSLAFFMHESSFGKSGEATESLSPGNLRCIDGFRCIDNYAWFDSWEDGFNVYCRLIRNLYVNTWGLITVPQIIPRYAPAADHNDEWAYIHFVEAAVDTWRAKQVNVAA